MALLGWFTPALTGDAGSSSFGDVVVPQPPRPVDALACVEPVEVMRREHMNFLLHQRDATVFDGERDSKYSLTGCMDCHNPSKSSETAETAVRYPDPEHFCAGCHLYASVRIDCFECHADRGLAKSQQGRLKLPPEQGLLSLQTFHDQLERSDGE
jgi:predicted CXXCH cytochrome family protein